MSNPTLESLVESAYSAALRTNQTELVDIRINLASSGINQTTTAADDNSGRAATTLPIPCIRLRAEATSQTIGSTNTPKWAVLLEVEVEQKANLGEGDGPTLDDLYSLATRPFYYGSPTLAATLETGNAALRVHGVSKRGEALQQEQLEATMVRRSTVTIHCAPVIIA
jgi:hypothetical protein